LGGYLIFEENAQFGYLRNNNLSITFFRVFQDKKTALLLVVEIQF
jgi:hypothetical protein